MMKSFLTQLLQKKKVVAVIPPALLLLGLAIGNISAVFKYSAQRWIFDVGLLSALGLCFVSVIFSLSITIILLSERMNWWYKIALVSISSLPLIGVLWFMISVTRFHS